jgi:menaquinone-dependent protoporphyrinogen oxidase
MPNKVLVAYTTNSGSTQQVAEAVAGELGKTGAAVEVRRLEEVGDLSPYGAVVVGGR